MLRSGTPDGTLVCMPPYERLKAWQECHRLVLETYRATRSFPREELYGLTSQTRRARVLGAADNLVGIAKTRAPEYRRFLYNTNRWLAAIGGAVCLAGGPHMLSTLDVEK